MCLVTGMCHIISIVSLILALRIWGVLLLCWCHNKTPHGRWLKQHKCIFSQFWKLEVQNQEPVGPACTLSSSSSFWWMQYVPGFPGLYVHHLNLCFCHHMTSLPGVSTSTQCFLLPVKASVILSWGSCSQPQLSLLISANILFPNKTNSPIHNSIHNRTLEHQTVTKELLDYLNFSILEFDQTLWIPTCAISRRISVQRGHGWAYVAHWIDGNVALILIFHVI